MGLEYGTFQIGNVLYPLTSSTANPPIADLDPALDATIKYLAWSITHYMGARWTAECTALGLDASISASPVAYTVGFEPSEYLQQAQARFPLLAVWRQRTQDADLAVQYYHQVGQWSVNWVMPTLAVSQLERLAYFTKAVKDIVNHTMYMQADPNYGDGVTPVLKTAGVEDIEVMDAAYGKAVLMGAETAMVFPGVAISMQISERLNVVTGAFDPVAGVDTGIGLESSGATIPDFIDITSP